MKKNALLLVFCICLPFIASSQDVKSVFKYLDKSITFFGIDFTRVKCMGNMFKNPEDIKSVQFAQWNRILYEEKKYDLKPAFRSRNVILEFSYLEKLNNTVDASKIINYSPSFLTVNDIVEMVENYEYGDKSGIGVVFIADLYDETKSKAFVHVVVFDLATKKVMIWEFMKGKPGGAGMRNYWSNAIANIIDRIKSEKYPKWEAEFVK
jgi:hypothetical protein